MDNEDESKYQVENEGQLYGQVVGENNQITQNFHLPLDEKHRQYIEATRRRQFCVPILTYIRLMASPLAKLRKAHDNLRERPGYFIQGVRYAREVDALTNNAQERFAVAGSELSIDPDGKQVMDALTECLRAKDAYVQAILQPLSKVQTHFFGKADIKVLDELARISDDKLTALEEAIRLYIN